MDSHSTADPAALSTATAALLAALLGGHGAALPDGVRDALADALRTAVADALVDALPAVVRRAALPTFLTRDELAELMGCSTRRVDYLRERGRLPYSKVGRQIRFKLEDVEALLDEARGEARVRRDETAAGRGR